MKSLNRLLFFYFGSILAACSLAPAYTPPAVQAPSEYKGAETWKPGEPSEGLSRGEWWLAFEDRDLVGLIRRLDDSNPDLAAAVARFDQARALASKAESGLFPVATLQAGMANNRQSDNRPLRSAGQPTYYSDHLVGASLGYELDLFGRVRNLVAAGRAGSEAARAEMESVKLSLRAELANDYISLRGADSELKFLNDIVESYSEAEMLTVSRFEGGITSELDVSRAKAQIDFARAKLSETSARRTLLEHAIATLTGESASTFSLPSGSLDLKVPSIPLGIPSTLLQRRPDIAAAERRVAAANSQIGIAKAAWFPTFFLGGAGGFESASVTGWLTAPDIFWSLGPQALVTLFDAGYRKAELNRVEAVLAESSAQYRGIVLRAFEEVEDNLTLLYEYEKESKDLEAEIRDTRRSVEIATNRYREGVANYLEVVTAQTANFQAELDDLTLRERRLHAEINLVRALGGGWNMTN